MYNSPDFISVRLINFLIEKRSLAYLIVDKNGYLSTWGGKLSVYGLKNLDKSKLAQKQIYFLTGLLPLGSESIYIPCLKISHGICADLYLFPSDIGDWILLLDVTEHYKCIVSLQQMVNEKALIDQNNHNIT
ncbi:MAG: hypothetical protein AAF208_03650 [Cyanobacteria bacterium P01_A01_bin.45]